jgi:hypothetical protein
METTVATATTIGLSNAPADSVWIHWMAQMRVLVLGSYQSSWMAALPAASQLYVSQCSMRYISSAASVTSAIYTQRMLFAVQVRVS